ncbi:MAG: CoA transferase [Acidimicrobiales bacterium]|jgi:crotonobetainyl-CoA:carnitine CoA-transferase CaiB-like acyl-CoA transferase|nr:CoA transferase [Acidimicrobiales bacterium]
MAGIMDGVRVLEVAFWTYVPSAGAVLAEWGADVLKIEHPDGGDPQRGLVTSGLVPSGPGGVNHMIELPNRGKRSVAIDLKTDEGHDLLMELAATSDVFLTSILPASRRAMRIEVEDIRAANPNIIYARGSGQGQEGPEAERGGYDGCSFWARTVADIATPAGADWPANQPGPAFGDLIGGLTIAGGISAALFHRERTGEALVVDNSLMATGMWATGATLLAAGLFGMDTMPSFDRTQAPNPIVNTYKTSDGRFLSLIMLQADRYWPDLVQRIGRPELLDDPRFVDAAARRENAPACVAALDEIFASRTFEEWKAVLADAEGVWGPVARPGELLEDPQVLANGYVRDVESASGSSFRMVPSPIQFDRTPPDLTRAPDLGEHTDEVLLELGKDMDEIIELKLGGSVL